MSPLDKPALELGTFDKFIIPSLFILNLVALFVISSNVKPLLPTLFSPATQA